MTKLPPIDLWPNGLFEDEVLKPETILGQQADLLPSKTNSIISGCVETTEKEGALTIKFLISDAKKTYRYLLFHCTRAADMPYPVTIHAKQLDDLGHGSESSGLFKQMPRVKAHTQEELIEYVRGILGSPQTYSVIQSFVARQYDVDDADVP